MQKQKPYVPLYTFLQNPSGTTACRVVKAEFCCSEKMNQKKGTEITERKEKALTSVLNKPFPDPKTEVITPINKPFVQALLDQENLLPANSTLQTASAKLPPAHLNTHVGKAFQNDQSTSGFCLIKLKHDQSQIKPDHLRRPDT